MNLHKKFRRCPGHLLDVLSMFNLRTMSRGFVIQYINIPLPSYRNQSNQFNSEIQLTGFYTMVTSAFIELKKQNYQGILKEDRFARKEKEFD